MRYFFLLLLCITFQKSLQAQVPVHEEPRHKPVFENEKVRLLNAIVPPGDTTQYHLHNTPSLFIFFTSTTTGSQLQGGAPTVGRSTGGTILFENLAPPHVRIHRVWNLDTSAFHVMDIELLSKDSGFNQKSLVLPHLQLAVDTPWVRVYKLVLEKKDFFQLSKHKYPLVIVSLATGRIQLQQNGSTQTQTLQEGTFFWIPAGQKFELKNVENATARIALIEIP